ncbi:MAG TPA: hypothetical protein PLU30_22715 [Verrucomicrobiae bacterium]|nr:hypothetical protein [Verrucomicrobiae bacterium]
MKKALAWSVSIMCVCAVPTLAQNKVIFDNQSGEPALVKLIGPTETQVEVPNGEKAGVEAVAGRYTIKARYGTPGSFRYSKGEEFAVSETGTARSETTITLHTVAAGNYDARPISEAEFGNIPTGLARQPEEGVPNTGFPVALIVSTNVDELPLSPRGTGFSGASMWQTPLFPISYQKTAYSPTNAILVLDLEVKDDPEQAAKAYPPRPALRRLSLSADQGVSGPGGTFICQFIDPYENWIYAGRGTLRVQLKDKATTNQISNILTIPVHAVVLANDHVWQLYEKRFGVTKTQDGK